MVISSGARVCDVMGVVRVGTAVFPRSDGWLRAMRRPCYQAPMFSLQLLFFFLVLAKGGSRCVYGMRGECSRLALKRPSSELEATTSHGRQSPQGPSFLIPSVGSGC